MSDFDPAPDPIDEAYRRAEALLSDEAARAARRERVMAAVGREPAVVAAAPALARRRPPVWRRGGWLAAACVAGLGLFIAGQVYQPMPQWPQTSPTSQAPSASPSETVAPIAAAPAHVAPTSAAPIPPAPIARRASEPASVSAYASKASPTSEVADSQRRAVKPPLAAPPPLLSPAPPPPTAAPVLAPAPRAFPVEPPAPQSAVTAEHRAAGRVADAANSGSGDAVNEVVRGGSSLKAAGGPASQSFAAAPGLQSRFGSFSARTFDQGAALRDAAEVGRTADVEALLDRGAPVDAPDAEGDTALIKSVQADHPAAAAALARHGASLDHKNRAGESARAIAAAKNDAALNQALGVGP